MTKKELIKIKWQEFLVNKACWKAILFEKFLVFQLKSFRFQICRWCHLNSEKSKACGNSSMSRQCGCQYAVVHVRILAACNETAILSFEVV